MATKIINNNQTTVKFVTGQKSYVDKKLERHRTDSEGEIALEPFYIANGIDLRQNVFEEFQKRRDALIKNINEQNALSEKEFNQSLQKEIKRYNKANTSKRVYTQEKRVTPKIKKSHISVTFNTLKFTYTDNPYMSFHDVIQMIKDVHHITQKSPMP